MTLLLTETEEDYRQARFEEYRLFSLRVSLAGALLVLGLWLRDYASDPAGAHSTMAVRFIMAGGVLTYATALWLRLRRGVVLLAAYVALLVIEMVVMVVWGRLAGGYVTGFPGYMYIYLLTPLMLLPFSLMEILPAMVLIGVVPNLQVAVGMAPGFPLLAFNVLVWPACAIVVFSLYEFDRLIRRLFAARLAVQELALKDSLTGVGNRRYFEERAKAALAGVSRRNAPLALLMIDIDRFKDVNDRHGHAAGDNVLRALAGTLSRSLRGGDACARLGGEEFVAVLPDQDRDGATATAERLRIAIERLNIGAGGSDWINFTASVGVAAYPQDGNSIAALMQRADARLYQAKEAGRNRVVSTG